jgi:hypothetical protein
MRLAMSFLLRWHTDRLPHRPPPTPRETDSLIVSQFPSLFDESRAKRFNRLWQDSRAGFSAKKFHRRRDDVPSRNAH